MTSWLDAIPETPPPTFHHAASQFNNRQFWECHETLEDLWRDAPEPLKTFLQGLIQTAAGFVHITRANYAGAASVLDRGLEKLEQVASVEVLNNWVYLPVFIHTVKQARQEVERLGPDNLKAFPESHFPVMMVPEG